MKKVVMVMALFGCAACSTEGPSGGGPRNNWGGPPGQTVDSQKALSVKATRVSRASISQYIVSNTTFESIRDVTVYSKLNAIVADLSVEEGDIVPEGGQLARLDDREIRNEYEQARIALDQAKLGVRQAQVRAELSAAEKERGTTLFQQKLISQQEFDQVVLTSRTDSLLAEEAQQQLVAAEARLEGVAIQLEYTSIHSPIGGVVTARMVDVGDRINVNEALFTIQEFPPLWARIYVPEKSLPALSLRQKAQIAVETYPEMEFEGRIRMISPTVDASSGTVKVTIEVDRPGHYLRPGMFGTVLIATETHENAIVIPKKAIVRERELNYVYVIQDDQTVVRKEVAIGFSDESNLEVVRGLDEGAVIVTVGHETLNDGYLVAVKGWEGEVPEGFQVPAQPVAPSLQTQRVDSRPGGAGSGRGGFFDRMMENPEIKKKYEARLAEDPSLATDMQKRRAFVREVMPQFRQSQGGQ